MVVSRHKLGRRCSDHRAGVAGPAPLLPGAHLTPCHVRLRRAFADTDFLDDLLICEVVYARLVSGDVVSFDLAISFKCICTGNDLGSPGTQARRLCDAGSRLLLTTPLSLPEGVNRDMKVSTI